MEEDMGDGQTTKGKQRKKEKGKRKMRSVEPSKETPNQLPAADSADQRPTTEDIDAAPACVRRILLRGGTVLEISAAVQWVLRALGNFPVDSNEIQALRDDVEAILKIDTSKRILTVGLRAFILLSLYLDESTATAVATQSQEDACYVNDMRTRVLPVLVPLYLDHLAQRPDIFVGMASVMHRLWPNEPVQCLHSNWRSVPLLAL